MHPGGVAGLRRRGLDLAAGYVGAVVGAGFASGREIAHFFARYGLPGLVGALLAGLLFGTAGAAVLRRVTTGGHAHYGSLLRDVCGPALGMALDRLGTLFLFIGLAAVAAGAGALGLLTLHWPAWCGLLVFTAALAATGAGGRSVHLLLSAALVPVLGVVCLAAGLHALPRLHSASAMPAPGAPPWALAAVLYVAYNLLLGLAGLCAAADGRQTLAEAVWAGWLGGAVLGLLCLAVTAGLLAHPAASGLDLPLAAALPAGLLRRVGYPLSLLAALWTTGSASALALGQRLFPAAPARAAAVLAALAAPVAAVGLTPIVSVAYPLMGYAGVPLLLALVVPAWPRSLPRWQRSGQRLP